MNLKTNMLEKQSFALKEFSKYWSKADEDSPAVRKERITSALVNASQALVIAEVIGDNESYKEVDALLERIYEAAINAML